MPLVAAVLLQCGGTGDGGPGIQVSPDGGDAGTGDQYEMCDGSEEIRFAFQVLGGGNQSPGDAALTQNGHWFLFVTGKCEYFAYGLPTDSSTALEPTYSGTLTKTLVEELTEVTALDDWTSSELARHACDGPNMLFWTRRASILLYSSCLGESAPGAEELVKTGVNIGEFMVRLFSQGSRLTGPVRLLAMESRASSTHERITWPLSTELSAVTMTSEEVGSLGPDNPAFLIAADPGLAELRELRRRAINGEFSKSAGAAPELLVDDGASTYSIRFRDVIDLEDGNGVVQLPN